MPKLKEVRNQLLISHSQGVINDEEFLLLYDLNKSKNLDLPYESYNYFDFDMLENDECLSEFRFHKRDIPLLADVLQVPDVTTCYQRSVCSGLEALCVVLKRLAYPCRYADMIPRFAKACFQYYVWSNNYMVDFSYTRCIATEFFSGMTPYLTLVRLDKYANSHRSSRFPFGELFWLYWWNC